MAVARLAGAIAYDNLGRPEAVTLGEDAEARLLELGISASGWRVLFDTATLVETVEPAVAD